MSASVDTVLIESSRPVWSKVLDGIRERLAAERKEQAFYTWIATLSLIGIQGDTAHIQAPTQFQIDWVSTNYSRLLLDEFRNHDESVIQIQYEVDPQGPKHIPGQITLPSVEPSRPAQAKERIPSPSPSKAPASIGDPLQQRFTFTEFVPGSCNRLAYSLSKEVASSPGRNSCNPLVLYGGSGLGKTHLLQATAHQALKLGTVGKVLYCTSDRLLKDWHGMASRSREFYKFYASADLLLVDDIQFLAPSNAAQQELVNLIRHLGNRHRQVVLTCDQLPQKVGRLQDSLLRETDNGVAIALEVPDLETRLAILRRKLGGYSLGEDVVRWIANHHDSNVRQMEGAITKLLAYRDLMGAELDLEAVRGWFSNSSTEPSAVTLPRIAETVALRFGLAPELLGTRARAQAVSLPRKIAMYLSRQLTGVSLKTIGLQFHRDYSTVMASIEWVEKNLPLDPQLRSTIETLRDEIRS